MGRKTSRILAAICQKVAITSSERRSVLHTPLPSDRLVLIPDGALPSIVNCKKTSLGQQKMPLTARVAAFCCQPSGLRQRSESTELSPVAPAILRIHRPLWLVPVG